MPESKFTDVLSRRQYGITFLWPCLSECCQLTYFTDPIRHLLWRISLDTLVNLSPCPVVPSILYCYVNVLFYKYFLHTACLVRLCDNPSLFFVWEEAKIWTQGTPHALLSHFCSVTCSTSIIWELAPLCCRLYLQTRDHRLDARNKKSHSGQISLCGPFWLVTGYLCRQW